VADNLGHLLHVAVADNQHLYAFVIDKLTERPEVADVRTSVIYAHLRNQAILPIPPRGPNRLAVLPSAPAAQGEQRDTENSRDPGRRDCRDRADRRPGDLEHGRS
jgi:hypothetical protein